MATFKDLPNLLNSNKPVYTGPMLYKLYKFYYKLNTLRIHDIYLYAHKQY
jgi:hypothetical protein